MPSTSCASGWQVTASEVCDREGRGSGGRVDLGAESCVSLGYAGGSLGCNEFCSHDTNGCTSCSGDPHLVSCRHTELAANLPHTMALAAAGDEIMVAWVPGPGLRGAPPVDGGARLARFGPDLSVISQTGCFGPAHAYTIAIARSPSGYLVAIEADGQVVVQSIDAAGGLRGGPRTVPNAIRPTLIARENDGAISGGPLLTWVVWSEAAPNPPGVEIRGQVLADNGSGESDPVVVFPAANPVPRMTGVFTGAGFLVAASYSSGLIARVALDGTVDFPATPPIAVGAYTGLVWNGSRGGVVYSALDPTTSPGSHWVPIDVQGNASGAPVSLEQTLFLPPAALALGDDVVIVSPAAVQTSVDNGNQLDVSRISSTGATVTASFSVVLDPEGVMAPRLARLGGDVILAWVGAVNGYPGRIGLARIAP